MLAKEAEFYAKSIFGKAHCQGKQKLLRKDNAYSFSMWMAEWLTKVSWWAVQRLLHETVHKVATESHWSWVSSILQCSAIPLLRILQIINCWFDFSVPYAVEVCRLYFCIIFKCVLWYLIWEFVLEWIPLC